MDEKLPSNTVSPFAGSQLLEASGEILVNRTTTNKNCISGYCLSESVTHILISNSLTVLRNEERHLFLKGKIHRIELCFSPPEATATVVKCHPKPHCSCAQQRCLIWQQHLDNRIISSQNHILPTSQGQ